MNLRLLLSNPHTSISALVYVGAKCGAQLGAIWFPAHAAQFQSTADVVEAAAVAYGLAAAGDASNSTPKPPTPPPAP